MSEPAHTPTHEHPHTHEHSHGHSHDHHHHGEEDSYFIDQLCMVGLSGAFGVICLCLWFWQTAMLRNLLAPQFHIYVLLTGIALTIITVLRGAILWQQSRDPHFRGGHDHHHHDHDHHHHDHEHKHDHAVQEQSVALGVTTAPCGHTHAPGETCSHDHAHEPHEHHIGHANVGPDHDEADHDHGWAPWRYVVILVPIILFLLGLPNRPPSITDTGAERLLGNFISIIYEAMPFIALGVILAGFLEEFVPQQALARVVPKNKLLAISIGAVLGLVFPMCECGIIVVMKRLLRKGLPLSVCVAYMLAGPVINVVVMTSTFVAFSSYNVEGRNDVLGGPWQVVAWRVGLSYLVAIVTALVVDWQWQRQGKRLLHPSVTHGLKEGPEQDAAVAKRSPIERVNNITQTALHDFVDILAFLVLGAVLAAVGKFAIHESNVQNVIREIPAVSILIMMGIAILFCLCSEADAFVAANFPLFWPDGSKLAFLVLGPMLDLKLLLMYTRVFRVRLIYTIVICLVIQVFSYTMVVHAFFGREHPPESTEQPTPFTLSGLNEAQVLAPGCGPNPFVHLTHFAAAVLHAPKGDAISFKDLVNLADKPDLRSRWDKKFVEVRGQYDPYSSGNDRAFMLSRLKITCCQSDLTTLSTPVLARESIQGFQKGDWITLTGQIQFRDRGRGLFETMLVVYKSADIVRSNPDPDPYVQ